MTQLEGRLQDLAKIKTLVDLDSYILDTKQYYDLANVAFVVTHSATTLEKNPIKLATYDPGWVKRYIENDYFQIDPVMVEGARCFLPLDWGQIDKSSDRIRRLFAESDSYGVGRQGMTLPIRGPGGEKSVITITSYEGDDHWMRRRTGLIRDFQMLAHYIHDRAVTLAGYRLRAGSRQLSRRELQCLERLARGRVPKVIAYELGLSISAVRLYICSAKVKLGAASTSEAIALAVRDEHIAV